MTQDRQRPPKVRKELLERFKQDVEERYGTLRGNYSTELERALESYLEASKGGDVTHRLKEIESDLEEIKGALSESDDKKKKETSRDSTTEKRLRKIRSTISNEVGEADTVHANVVEMAIREVAGSSAPTIRRYKELLNQDRTLFQHPAKESVYFRDPGAYAGLVNQMAERGGLTNDEYWGIVDGYGEDWWRKQLDDTKEHNERGIQ